MNIDGQSVAIAVGVVTILGMILGQVGSYFTAKAKADATAEKVEAVTIRVARLDGEFNEFKSSLPERYVRQSDIDRMEARLSERMTAVEQSIRSMVANIVTEFAAKARAPRSSAPK